MDSKGSYQQSPHVWEPGRKIYSQIKTFLSRALHFDLHLLLSLPIFLIFSVFLVVEGCLYCIVRLTGRLVEKWSNPRDVRLLIHKLVRTTNFSEYAECAERLDELTNRNIWKEREDVDIASSDYDASLIRRKIKELQINRKSRDPQLILGSVKSCLDTQLHGTLNEALFSMTFSGTKYLSNQLHEEVILSLRYLESNLPSQPDLLQSISQLFKEFGSTALVLSGGAMLGFHHLGLLETLIKLKLFPKIIAGTSAGSALAAFVCTRSDEEILKFIKSPEMRRDFSEPFAPNNWLLRLRNVLKWGYSIDVDLWIEKVDRMYGTVTFLEAYQATGRILNITASRAGDVGECIVLNYQNAPHILISTAVLASSAFPYLGCPVHLLEKHPDTQEIISSREYSQRFYHDGSLRGDVPSDPLRSRWGVKYIVVSQVNPHVFPFLGMRTHGTAGQPVRGWGSASIWRGGFPLAMFEVALKEHLRFLLRVLALLDLSPTINGISLRHVALQCYGGDLNIYPSRLYVNHIYLMNNIPPHLVDWFLNVGRQMVFPKIWILKARLSVESAVMNISLAAIRLQQRLAAESQKSPPNKTSNNNTTSSNNNNLMLFEPQELHRSEKGGGAGGGYVRYSSSNSLRNHLPPGSSYNNYRNYYGSSGDHSSSNDYLRQNSYHHHYHHHLRRRSSADDQNRYPSPRYLSERSQTTFRQDSLTTVNKNNNNNKRNINNDESNLPICSKYSPNYISSIERGGGKSSLAPSSPLHPPLGSLL